MRQRMQPERARRNCPNSELPSSNLDQFFVSPLGGAKKRLGASDLTRGLHGHSCLRVRVGTLELPKRDKSIAKLQILYVRSRLVPLWAQAALVRYLLLPGPRCSNGTNTAAVGQ